MSPARVSIHAPRMGSDASAAASHLQKLLFQSTLPAWGATLVCQAMGKDSPVSIHAPRMGSDHPGPQAGETYCKCFNPRSPHGERPKLLDDPVGIPVVSIHAPRMGSDLGHCYRIHSGQYVSIHAPRMGSDLPIDTSQRRLNYVSIHAPRMGSDAGK